jgi:hypothetical protein
MVTTREGHYANPNLLDRYRMRRSILRAFGWRFVLVLTKDWHYHPDRALGGVEKSLRTGSAPDCSTLDSTRRRATPG